MSDEKPKRRKRESVVRPAKILKKKGLSQEKKQARSKVGDSKKTVKTVPPPKATAGEPPCDRILYHKKDLPKRLAFLAGVKFKAVLKVRTKSTIRTRVELGLATLKSLMRDRDRCAELEAGLSGLEKELAELKLEAASLRESNKSLRRNYEAWRQNIEGLPELIDDAIPEPASWGRRSTTNSVLAGPGKGVPPKSLS